MLVLRRDADARKPAPAGRLRVNRACETGHRVPCQSHRQAEAVAGGGCDPDRPVRVIQRLQHGAQPVVAVGVIQGEGAAFGGCAVFQCADLRRNRKVRQSSVHRSFLGGFGVTVGQHSFMQGQVGGNAGHVVVFMPRRAGNDPGQVHGVEEGHGAGGFARDTESFFQRIQQLHRGFGRIPGGVCRKAGEAAALAPMGDVVSHTAADKGDRSPLFCPYKGIFIGKIRVAEQQPVHFSVRAGRIPLPGRVCLPQGQQGSVVRRGSITYHGISP